MKKSRIFLLLVIPAAIACNSVVELDYRKPFVKENQEPEEAGEMVIKATVETSDTKTSLDGTDVEETTIVPLTEEAQAMLDAAASGDDITLRLHGTSHDYDINVK